CAADSMKFSVLEHTQELGLQRERHVSDLAQEARASVRHFQLALLQPVCAGECASLMSKKFVLKQRFREGDTVDDHQRHGLTRAPLVDGTGEEFLTRATFTKE